MITVLFVDDEASVTDAIRVALRHHPVHIFTASSAAEGLAVLQQNDVDVVISDEKMAPVPGSVFLTEVRRKHPGTERVILTGQASVQATIAAINDADVFRILVKPCPPEEILSCINDAVAAHHTRRSASEVVDERRKAEGELADALDGAEVWFQPIFDRNLDVWGCEALLRPQSVSLPTPDVLISTAARLGRHIDVDRHVRRTVANRLAAAPNPPVVFVNLMPESLADPQLATPDDPLAPYANGIVLEITERAELSIVPDIQSKMHALRALGHRIAIDDLGAGYSGLSSFAQLEPDVVKFDLDLVRSIDSERTNARLVQSIIEACEEMHIVTLAEGVETEAELATLMDLKCDLYQGYLLGKPAPAMPTRGCRSQSAPSPEA